VKDAAARKRQKYENFLSTVEILKAMDPYERSSLADAFKEKIYKPGEFIIQEGEEGHIFYLVEEGNAYASKVLKEGDQPTRVMEY
jgi:cAMP-dependent protein kinase regulator